MKYIFYNTFHVKTIAYSGAFAWWHEMNDTSKGAVIGGSILFVIIMIICCYCCCCRSRPNNQGVILMQPAGGPSVLTTSNSANVAIWPLAHQTWDAPSFAETISEPRALIPYSASLHVDRLISHFVFK